MNLATCISIIVAICSVISPMFTSIIDNMFKLRLKRIELEQKNYEDTVVYKRTILENYLKYTGRCISDPTEDTLRDYGQFYTLALIYVPNDIRSKMIDLNKLIRSDYWSDASTSLNELTALISRAILQL